MKYTLIGLSLMLISLCSKENGMFTDENDYLIFGHFYGECLGEECVEIFKLTQNELYEDTTGGYLSTEFDFVLLKNESYEKTRDLIDAVPSQLLREEVDAFGCPDCADQGGLYIEVVNKGKKMKWQIDHNKSAVPVYLHDFMDRVNLAIKSINE